MKLFRPFTLALFLHSGFILGAIYPSISGNQNGEHQSMEDPDHPIIQPGRRANHLRNKKNEIPFSGKIHPSGKTTEAKKGFSEVGEAAGFGMFAELNLASADGGSIQIKDEVGQNMGTLNPTLLSFGVKIAGGYRFRENRSVFLGLGAGLDYFLAETPQSKASMFVPLTLELNACNLQGSKSPILAFSGGYALGISGLKGGVIFHPQAGLKVGLSGTKALHFLAGYKVQGRESVYYFMNSNIEMERTNKLYGFLTLSGRLIF